MYFKHCIKLVLSILCLLQIGESYDLIKQDGIQYITGNGCGSKIPFIYLNEVPEDIQMFPCGVINPSKLNNLKDWNLKLSNKQKINALINKTENYSVSMPSPRCFWINSQELPLHILGITSKPLGTPKIPKCT